MRRAAVIAGCASLVAASAGATSDPARVTFEVRAPVSTPARESLWVCGDHPGLGRWNGSGLALARSEDGTWRASLALPAGTAIEFKVTRGDWARVEKDEHGGEIANRSWTVQGEDTVRVVVAAWRDQSDGSAAARPSTITGTVRRHPRFASRYVAARDVLVWLPPGYDAQPQRRYPVLYFLDGQNVFDGATSFLPGQEWGADEAAERLVRSGQLAPCLMVAVANSGARADEYTLAADPEHGGGKATLHQRFLLDELKRMVDATYRTRPDAEHTGVIGSSLGGLAALDLLLEHPDQVGLAGCVSPAAWWAGREIVERVGRGRGHGGRVWLDIGTAESVARAPDAMPWVDDARALRDGLLARGWREGIDLHYEEVDGAKHNEAAWAARVGRIMCFLVGPAVGR